MNLKEAKNLLLIAIENGFRIMLAGPSGVGKTAVEKQVCDMAGVHFIPTHPVVNDVADYKGQPWVIEINGQYKAVHLPYGDIEKILNATEPTIVGIEDLGQSPKLVQASLMQFLWGGELNGLKIPECVTFWATTNRREDGCGVGGILECVKRRFHGIYNIEFDVNAWTEWAYAHDIHPAVISWVQFQPGFVTSDEVTSNVENRPCGRTCEYASDWLWAGQDSTSVLTGPLGPIAGASLAEHAKVFKELPDLDQIRKNPDTAPIPTSSAALYAVITSLVSTMAKKSLDALWTYAIRLDKEFQTLMGMNMLHAAVEMKNGKRLSWAARSSMFPHWAAANRDVQLDCV